MKKTFIASANAKLLSREEMLAIRGSGTGTPTPEPVNKVCYTTCPDGTEIGVSGPECGCTPGVSCRAVIPHMEVRTIRCS